MAIFAQSAALAFLFPAGVGAQQFLPRRRNAAVAGERLMTDMSEKCPQCGLRQWEPTLYWAFGVIAGLPGFALANFFWFSSLWNAFSVEMEWGWFAVLPVGWIEIIALIICMAIGGSPGLILGAALDTKR